MLCAPALIYLVISIIALTVHFANYSALSALFHIIFIIFWTTILNWICSKNMAWLSWILVFLPYVLFALVTLLILESLALNSMKIFDKNNFFNNLSSLQRRSS